MSKVTYSFITGFCWGMSPWVFELAQSTRDEVAIGGEIMIFILPLVIRLSYEIFKDCLEWTVMAWVGINDRLEGRKNDTVRNNRRDRVA